MSQGARRAVGRAAPRMAAGGRRLLRRLATLWLHRNNSILRSFTARNAGIPSVLFEQAGAGMVVADRAGRIVAANAAMRDMTGPLSPAVPGARVSDLFGPDRRQQVEDELRAVLSGRARPVFTSHLDDPRSLPDAAVNVALVALCRPGGGAKRTPTPEGVLMRIIDLTPQRQLQAQLAQAQKLQAVGSLAGGIAHDFNNLLTAVLGAAEAIAQRPNLDRETLDDVAQIQASAQRGEGLVRQLLAFGRQQTLQPQVLEVNERISDLSGMLRRLLGSTIKLELALEEPGRRVRADPTQLDQVIVNLAVNARDAMTAGGALTLRSGHVTLYRPLLGGAEIIPPGRYVMVEVEDTGSGIAPELLPRIFDPFFTTKRDRGGNGLGLSTVHGIVRQSEGFIGIESEVGRGTRVRVYLPRYDGDAMAIPHVPEPANSPAVDVAERSLKEERGLVLLVDDEEPVLRLAERALTRQGWRVLAAPGGLAALARLAQLPPGETLTALVSDMVMPDMDGAALVRAVRERLGMPHLPALLVSGYAEASLRTAMSEAEAVGFLPKPYALKQLTERLAEQVRAAAAPVI